MKPKNIPSLPETKAVGIWIRVSTEDQARGESPQHHLERARAYAVAKGWKVKEVYDLAGTSGKTVAAHPEAKRMRADIERGHITGLIFSKLARLARNTVELLEFSDFFRAHGADLVSLQESIDTSSPAGRLFYTMIAAMAQWEREETVDRVNASVAVRAKLGSPLGGPASFGYQWKDKKLVPHPDEAPVRKLMYDLYLKHRRKKSAVRELNEAGHRTRKGVRFTAKTFTRLIQDPTAKGVHRVNYTTRNGQGKQCTFKPEHEWIMHEVPAIVTPEIWDACNKLIQDSYVPQKRPAKKVEHLFAGIAHCTCGEKMYVPSNSPKYVCRACRGKIAIKDLEEIFIEEIKNYSFSSRDIAAYLKKADENVAEKRELLAVQESEVQKIQREITRVYQLYQQEQLNAEQFGAFYKPLEERKKQLEESIPKLQAEIDIAKVNSLSAEEVAAEAGKLHEQWPKLATDEKRAIVETIVETMVIGKDEITLNLCYLPSGKDMAKGWRKGWDLNRRREFFQNSLLRNYHPTTGGEQPHN